MWWGRKMKIVLILKFKNLSLIKYVLYLGFIANLELLEKATNLPVRILAI